MCISKTINLDFLPKWKQVTAAHIYLIGNFAEGISSRGEKKIEIFLQFPIKKEFVVWKMYLPAEPWFYNSIAAAECFGSELDIKCYKKQAKNKYT